MSKRILVTGGTGFIGSNLSLELLRLGHDVIITGNEAEQHLPEFKGKILQPSLIGLDWKALGHIDVVLHQAASNDTTSTNEREMMWANVDAPRALFEYAARNGCGVIVFASSTAIYGDAPAPYKEDGLKNPLNAYARSKAAQEAMALEFAAAHPDIRVVGLRYCNVYGPREKHKGKRASMIPQLAEQMKKGLPKIFKYGEQKRDYIYVKDVVRANFLAMEAKENCIVNCGSGKATTFNELIRILNKVMGMNKQPEYIENPHEGAYQSYTECNMVLAKEKIGFVPEFDIQNGIEDYAASGFLL